jgi:cytochrome b
MQIRIGNHWTKTLLKILRHPAVEVVAAMVVVLIAAWVVIATEADRRAPLFPLLFGHK